MDQITFDSHPTLRSPMLICAFEGWNDAADAATGALSFLRSRWQAERFARIDPEQFFDFQMRRPHVTLIDGITRKISWPASEFFGARLDGERDAMLFLGIEPNFCWKTFTGLFVDLAKTSGVELVVTLGALLADVPHTGDVRVIGTAAHPDVVARLGLASSRYEGPSGIVGVLHDAMATAGIDSVSLWASVPHYVAAAPNPKATGALVKRLGELLGSKVDTEELDAAGVAWEARVGEIVAANPEVATYVSQLESAQREPAGSDEPDVPTGDKLAEELERFLREQEGGTGNDKSRGPA